MTPKKILIFLLILLFGLAVYYFYLLKIQSRFSRQESSPASGQSSAGFIAPPVKIVDVGTTYKLPAGEQTYNITHGDQVVGPRASKISYRPLPLTPGQSQTITVTFPATETVSSAVIFMGTDHLEKQKVTLKKSQDPNVWVGSWTPSDTADTRDYARLYFVGPSGTYDNVMTFL